MQLPVFQPIRASLGSLSNDNSVVFQILLSDLLQTQAKISSINTIFSKKKKSPSDVSQILQALHFLVGSCEDCLYTCSFRLDNAFLTQIKNLSKILLANSGLEKSEFHSLSRSAFQAWMQGKALSEALYASQKTEDLSDYISDFSSAINDLKKNVFESVHFFARDENVLYFILRHREEVDSLWEKGYALNFLGNLFPNGLKEFEAFLLDHYEERGFSFLKSRIKEHLTGLKKG